VHLRRALLLFAIVLGLAALAASLSRSGDDSRESPQQGFPPPSTERTEPTVSPGQSSPGRVPANLRFSAQSDETRRLAAGRPATVLVAVEEPGQVQIPLLGVSTPADPLTPARFEVLPSEARRYPIVFTPAEGDEARAAGTLVVTAPKQ
jgi:hypothetical protein